MPFALTDPPYSIAFSGGRTSGYMLHRILEAHEGTLPLDTHVLFANTGREHFATLDFVERCSQEWQVPITWLEYDPDEEDKTRIVNHNTASRNGEPFEKIIAERKYMPSPRSRYCSEILKIRRIRSFMVRQGYKNFTNIVGIRYDEPQRVARIRKRNEAGKERFEAHLPLADAKVTKADIARFWREQPFDLGLSHHNGVAPLGNCDCCFLKSYPKILSIMTKHPELAEWWVKQEENSTADTPAGRRFRIDRPSYEEMLRFSRKQLSLDLK